MDSLKVTDQAAADVAVAPRVTLDSIKAKIKHQYIFTADKIVDGQDYPPELRILTMCVLVMQKGFTVIGKSAPASPENYNKALGEQFAYEDAVRQIWPIEGYALRERLYASA
jgi:hypothetical protein